MASLSAACWVVAPLVGKDGRNGEQATSIAGLGPISHASHRDGRRLWRGMRTDGLLATSAAFERGRADRARAVDISEQPAGQTGNLAQAAQRLPRRPPGLYSELHGSPGRRHFRNRRRWSPADIRRPSWIARRARCFKERSPFLTKRPPQGSSQIGRQQCHAGWLSPDSHRER
jgi:hypothetical protein